ncbi:uncharacterized protein J3R85_000649 [Psidium guajava]|nr:uncharacterized protein J3R85_000649 [Psidium guajava]
MGRAPCCDKANVKRGPLATGLLSLKKLALEMWKSCRLRWLELSETKHKAWRVLSSRRQNYLHPLCHNWKQVVDNSCPVARQNRQRHQELLEHQAQEEAHGLTLASSPSPAENATKAPSSLPSHHMLILMLILSSLLLLLQPHHHHHPCHHHHNPPSPTATTSPPSQALNSPSLITLQALIFSHKRASWALWCSMKLAVAAPPTGVAAPPPTTKSAALGRRESIMTSPHVEMALMIIAWVFKEVSALGLMMVVKDLCLEVLVGGVKRNKAVIRHGTLKILQIMQASKRSSSSSAAPLIAQAITTASYCMRAKVIMKE